MSPVIFGAQPSPGIEMPDSATISKMSSEFAFEKGIVTIDIDGTLTEFNTEDFSDPGIGSAVNLARDSGFVVCLMSARPRAFVETIQRRLDICSPFIAELGNLVCFPSLSVDLLIDPVAKTAADMLVENVGLGLKSKGDRDMFNYIDLGEVDPILSIRTWQKLPGKCGQGYDRTVAAVRPKLTSAGYVVVRTSDGSTPMPDLDLQNAVCEVLEESIPTLRSPRLRKDPSGMFVDVVFGKSSKASGWDCILSLIENKDNGRFFHIGDTNDDVIQLPGLSLLAVSNADNAMLNAANRVSEYPVTKGAVDHLNWIVSS